MKTIASECDLIGKDVVSFELAKTLKKLGYNQNVSNFVYDDEGNLLYIDEYFHHNINIDEFEYFDAPTVSELLSKVPYEKNNNFGLADNLAKMWIFLKEEGYIL